MNTLESSSIDEGPGSYSLDGWYYQQDASVLAALELLLVKRVSKALFLEPASEEDMEAELDGSRVTSSASLESELLVVQAKLRRSGPWTPAKLKAMVEHGTRRPAAIERLANPRVRYVLVTNADVNGELQALKIEDLLERTECTSLPDKVFPEELVDKAAHRFGILGLHTGSRLEERMRTHLMYPLCIPIAKLDECVAQLRADALARIRSGAVWTRQELEEVIRSFEGTIASDRRDEFVQPDNWQDMLAKLDRYHAIVLTGPSGTGKTTTARALAAYLKAKRPGYRIVDVERGPTEIRQSFRAGPTIFHVVDPWGRYEVTDERHGWSQDLKDFILSASAEHVFIVTTRSDVLSAAMGASKFLEDRQVELATENYGPPQLSRIYALHLARLPSGTLRTAAHTARAAVLERLRTPFEIVRFFAHLRGGPGSSDNSEGAFVARVLAATQHDSIEVEVSQLIQARNSYRWAAVLWALLTTNDGVSREDLPALRRRLIACEPDLKSSSIEELVNVLVAGGNLLQHGSRLSFAHPRVEQGFVLAMRKKLDQAEDALIALSTALVQMSGQSPSATWVANAARVCDVAKREFSEWAPVDADVQQAIDDWLDATLVCSGTSFHTQMELAANVGSARCHAAELARWLRIENTEEDRHAWLWKLPGRSEAWYATMYADIRTRPLCGVFIQQEVARAAFCEYPYRMAEHLDRLADQLDGDWHAAAARVIKEGYENGTSLLAFGAMRYPHLREPLLEEALNFAASLGVEPVVPESWDYRDGYITAHEVYQDADPAGHGAQEMVRAYVRVARQHGGWQKLSIHPRMSELLEYWASLLSDEALQFADGELIAIAHAAEGSPYESYVWEHLRHRWTAALAPLLVARLTQCPQSEALRDTLAGIARDNLVQHLSDLVTRLLEGGDNLRAMELAFEAYPKEKYWSGKKPQIRNYRRFAALLPGALRELVLAFTPIGIPRRTQLADQPLALVHGLKQSSRSYLRAWSTWLTTINGQSGGTSLRALLDGCVDPDDGLLIVRCAVEAQDWDVVWHAVEHERADVRQFSFQALVERNGGVVPAELYRLASDRGHRVRQAVINAIANSPRLETIPLLIGLCADSFSEEYGQGGDYPSCPVAWSAAKALQRGPRIPDELLDSIRACALATADLDVRDEMFEVLAAKGGIEGPRILASIITKTPWGDECRAAAKALLTSSSAEYGMLTCPALNWFESSNLSTAIFSASCVGRLSLEPQVLSLCASLSTSSSHRALLIAVAFGADTRDPLLVERVLGYLPPSHPARAAVDVLRERRHPLAYDALDDLGDVRVANALARIFDTVIEKRPKAVAA